MSTRQADYIALENAVEKKDSVTSNQQSKEINELGKKIIRQIIIPELTKEVNEGESFVKLRQVYNSLILASWYKKKVKDSVFLQVYTDQYKIAGVNINDPNEKQKIYDQYLQAFKKGTYDYIKEEYDPATQSIIPKKYFSGGLKLSTDKAMVVGESVDQAEIHSPHEQEIITVDITSADVLRRIFNSSEFIQNESAQDTDSAMLSKEEIRSLLTYTFKDEEFEQYWPDLSELEKASGDQAKWLFQYGVPAVKDLIQDKESLQKIVNDLIELGKANRKGYGGMYRYGIPAFRKAFGKDKFKEYWPDLIEIAKASGENARWVFQFGLPNVKHLIHNRKELNDIGNDLIKMSQEISKDEVRHLFQDGLLIYPINNRLELQFIGDDLIKLSKISGRATLWLYRKGLPAFREKTGTRAELIKMGAYLATLARLSGGNAQELFEKGLPNLEYMMDRVSSESLMRLAKDTKEGFPHLLAYSIPALQSLISNDGLSPITHDLGELGKGLKEGRAGFFEHMIPLVKELINNRNDLRSIGKDLVALRKAAGAGWSRYAYGLPSLKQQFGVSLFKQYWPILVELGISVGPNAEALYTNGLPAFKDLIQTKEGLRNIGNELVALSKIAGEHTKSLFEYGLQAFRDRIKNKEDLQTIGNELIALSKTAGKNTESLFQYGLPAVQELFRQYERSEVTQRLSQLSQLVNNYNAQRIFSLLKNTKIFMIIKDLGGDGLDHFDFYLDILKNNSRLGLQIWEGLFEAIKQETVDVILTEESKQSIKEFVKLTNGFNPVFYDYYKKEGAEKLQGLLSEWGKNILNDQLDGQYINDAIAQFNAEGYDGEQIVLSLVQKVIPSSGASFVQRKDIQGLFSKYMEAGDRREDVPLELRNKRLEGVNLQILRYRVKEGQVYDAEGKIKAIVEALRYPSEIKDETEKEESQNMARKEFKKGLEIYLKAAQENRATEEDKTKVLQRFYEWAQYNDLLKEKIDVLQEGEYASLEMLEALFYDKDNLPILMREVIKEINPQLLLRHDGGEIISNPGRAVKTINDIWNSPRNLNDKKEHIRKLLTSMAWNEITTKIIPQIDGELKDLVLSLEDQVGIVSVPVNYVIGEIFDTPVKDIQFEKSKFEAAEIDDKIKLRFQAVKGVPFGLWGLLAGVCIATDIALWKKKEFYLLAMIDESSGQTVGFVHMFEVTAANGDKILTVPGVEPSVEFLATTDSLKIYDAVEKALKQVAALVGYKKIYLPQSNNILSNRSDINKTIVKRNYQQVDLVKSGIINEEVKWNTIPTSYSFSKVYEMPLDMAMVSEIKTSKATVNQSESNTGGIDFTASKTLLGIQNSGEAIKFQIDAAMLEQMQNAPGFVPVIINIKPLNNLPLFLGIKKNDDFPEVVYR